MSKKQSFPNAENPLILRANRLMEAFAKSDDERDFYLDRVEGFIIYVDLDKPKDALESLEEEIKINAERYCLIPKLSFYESKKIMESFVNEKVYDIDTKEKLLDIIQSKEARENFLDFIYDQHTELEKWQQFYQERSRIRIIEWLRNNHFHFVFEEDLDIGSKVVEKLKEALFESKVGKDILQARKTLFSKAKTYYSNEALNPRPKRGRPPKQIVKQEFEPQISPDIYTTVPSSVRQFLFTPDLSGLSAASFSSKYKSEEELLAHRGIAHIDESSDINKKLASLRDLSRRWIEKSEKGSALDVAQEAPQPQKPLPAPIKKPLSSKALNGESSSKQPEKKPILVKKSEEKEKVKEEKKPLRSIMKSPEASQKTQKTAKPAIKEKPKDNGKKRIIQKDAGNNKKPVRKIIPNNPKKLSKKKNS